jgi:hypothetical protein
MSRAALLLALALALPLAACVQPMPQRHTDSGPPVLASRDAEGTAAWLAARGHPPLGEYRSVMSQPDWVAGMDREALLERWEQWWAGRDDPGEVAGRRAGLRAALGLD